jgi:drug/metabolite transporter (DMT)-like permease
VGTLILSVASPEGGGAISTFSGDMLVFGAALAAALYVIAARSSLHQLSAVPLAALQQTCGLLVAVACLPLAAHYGEFAALPTLPASAWAVAIITGVVQYGLAFILYLGALKYVSATRATLSLMFIPVFGVLGAVLFLGEQMSSIQMIGAALLLPSLFGARRLGR